MKQKTRRLTLLLLLISFAGYCQNIEVKKNEIYISIPDSCSVKSGFKTLAKATSLNMKHYRRYVVRDGVTYFKPGIRLSNRYYQLVDLYKINSF